jgi:hypothetical protein
MTFTEYAKSKGMHLLSDDTRYIRANVAGMPSKARHEALRRYVDTWVKARDDCICKIKADNIGRRAANEFLRKMNARYGKVV